MSTKLTDLQEFLVTRISTDPFLAPYQATAAALGTDLPVVSEKKGDVVQLMLDALNSLGGIGCVIGLPTGRLKTPEQEESLTLDVNIIVEIHEFVTVNQADAGIKLPALTWGAAIMNRVHWSSHGLNPGVAKLSRIWCDPIPYELVSTSDGLLSYQFRFLTRLNLNQ